MALARQVLCVCALLGLPLAGAEPIRYSVAEEAESGSLVGELAEDAGLTPAQLSARRARLVSEDGRQHFRLERASGRLVVAGRLDREQLCAQSDTCMLPFELLLSNPLQFFRVEVTVKDINDHSPVFREDRVNFRIPETSEPGSRFPLEMAWDLDIGTNTVQEYNMSPKNEYFSVSYGSSIKGKKSLELVLEKPLDREEHAEMGFSVMAVDGGSPPRSGSIEISVIILDANDNAPIFTQEEYIAKVLENMPEGSVILTVWATDPDAGVNGDISYQLSEVVGQSDSAFVIDPITGEIKLTKTLDFEAAHTHKLSVRATDGGGLSAISKVLVEVVDVNDNAPELVVSSFSSPLPENTVPGTVVALFTVRDRDSGANGKISCALQDQLFFSLRPAYKNYYELVTVSALDREETPQYILSVTAADAGSPPLTSTHTFTVDISDVNDNAPVFNQTSYTMYVRENNVPTVFVGAVSAADADVGLNAKVSYSLAAEQGPERAWCSCISVNSEKGHVFVLRPLDYERLRQTEVTVSASDAGSPPLRANVTVRLVVLDENDNAPLVLYPAQESGPASSELVPVSAEAGYLISKVVAVDADSGQNSWLSYHLLRATDPGLFSVGVQSGEVRLRRPVTERDSVKQKLVVLVRDNGKPPLSATAALSALLLKDFSDVRLPHSSPASEDQAAASLTTYLIIALVFVSLLFLISTAVLLARKVCRRKELKAGPVLYAADTLQSGLADAAAAGTLPRAYCYEISLTTGSGNSEFRFLKPILPSLPPQHCAVGQGPDEEQDFPGVPVSSEDMAPDNAGTLTAGQFNALSFDYEGAEALSSWVVPRLCAALVEAAFRCRPRLSRCLRDRGPGRAAARAAGGGGCSPSAHRWVVPSAKAAPSGCGSGGGRRRPESETAREGARPALRRSPPAIARDTRRDTDTGTDTDIGRRRRRAMALARQVLCVCALLGLPLAGAEPIRYSVAEEAESGSLVGELAEDAGLTPAQLSARRARLVSEDGRQHFRLERASGRLVVAGRLDREQLCAQSDTCMLPFELLLSNPLQFFRVEVDLEDINDHSPVFPEDRVLFDILETSEPGSLFPLEVARDLDIGSNTVKEYRIFPENEYFSVSYGSRNNGDKYLELVLEKSLDREEQSEMGFSVIAADGGSPSRSGTIEVSITILDVNDNAPKFTQERYIGKVLENIPEGSVVLNVLATDPDAGVNGDISYQFSQAADQSDSAFVIDPITGEIKITKPLDFEAAQTHELSVRARDGGGLSAICKVLVEVVDVNDNAPELVVSSFSSPLPENTVPGTVVALFTVRDRDSGANGKISCALQDQLFFSLRPAYKNYYELVTVSALDREETPQHILSVTAADAGSPPLTSTHTFTVDISDVNDNAPVFNQTSYTMYVRENNVPTVFVGAVSAADADVGLNAKVSYSLAAEQGPERAWCSCISVNSEKGHVFVLRPLDYERLRQTEVTVSASDAGSPPLRANVTVRLVVLDENDNAPLVLYPAQESGPASSELVPVSAEAGYLISKVVAVDADSGQNSWLSYHLLRATDPGLFSVGLQSGEVRLRRPVTERDSVKQKLVVLVRDNGKPPLSATAALSALLLKEFSDVRLPHSSPASEDQAAASLTTYLIIALVFVSLLFLISTAVLLARKVCRRKELKAGPVLYAADTLQSGLADAAAAGTLPRAYCYEISLTTGSGNSEFRFLKPILPSLPPQHCAVGQGPGEEQDFPGVPVSSEDMAPDNAGTLSAGQFNALSFN
ncbi:uncharacterized protein VK521_009112 [Ammospiza maritima maritima]